MRRFSSKDLTFSLITGFTAGFIGWQIFDFLNIPLVNGISFAWLMALMPIFWILGVNLGYFLGIWIGFFNQFGKFSAIGLTNAAVDFGILNLLIFYSGEATGVLFSVFKGISFLVAATHSYFWNKYWVFEAGATKISGQEFLKFFSVTLIAFFINVAVASVIVNFVGPRFGLTLEAWANVGAVVGSLVALVASFTGYKKTVF